MFNVVHVVCQDIPGCDEIDFFALIIDEEELLYESE